MDNQRLADFMAIWNAAMCFVYARVALGTMISLFQLSSGLQTSVSYSADIFGKAFALAVFGLILAIITGLLNVAHAIRFIEGSNTRHGVSYLATISFVILVCFEIYLQINDLATYANESGAIKDASAGMALDLLIWVPLIIDFLNLVFGVLMIVYTIRNSEKYLELAERLEPKEKPQSDYGIAADVATHAAGRPAPVNDEGVAKHTTGLNSNILTVDEVDGKPAQEEDKVIEKTITDEKAASDDDSTPEVDHRGDIWNGEEWMSLTEGVELMPAGLKEKREQETKKKTLPPLLSSNPDNKMLGKINTSGRMLAVDAPTFAAPMDAVDMEARRKVVEETQNDRRLSEALGAATLKSAVRLEPESNESGKDEDAERLKREKEYEDVAMMIDFDEDDIIEVDLTD